MRPYLALMRMDLRLALRNRTVIFFNYVLPLVFFFIFSEMFHAGRGGMTPFVVSMVLVIGIMSNGLFGAGIRAVQDREANVLRRFKVAPISPMPILVSSVVTGALLYVPLIAIVLALAHSLYGLELPPHPLSFAAFVGLGIVAFRAIGLIIASTANSAQQSQILVQCLYFPLMFLGGVTIPISMLPSWGKSLSLFLPTSYLVNGMQGMLLRGESLADDAKACAALLLTVGVGLFIANKLFRWEKEEKLKPAAKAWVLGVLLPFVALGALELKGPGLHRVDALFRSMSRGEAIYVRGARVFVGDGRVLEQASVAIKDGKIKEVIEGAPPDASELKSRYAVIEGAGLTLLPGLVDAHVHLVAPAGIPGAGYDPSVALKRALATNLYCGVTAVRSLGEGRQMVLDAKAGVARGEFLGAEVFAAGPLFTAEGGHGTEFYDAVPDFARAQALDEGTRRPKTDAEAREMVRALKADGVDVIKTILEAGWPGRPFNRLPTGLAISIGAEARAQGLPYAVHTGEARDVADALQAGATTVEHGSFRDEIPDATLAELAAKHVALDPTLAVADAFSRMGGAVDPLFESSLVRQTVSEDMLARTRDVFRPQDGGAGKSTVIQYDVGVSNLLRAGKAGVPLILGTDSGNMMVFHGPSVHRELALWVQAGIPATVALQAATSGAAKALGAGDRLGLVKAGYDANLLLVQGNPLEDIHATERISSVIFRGEDLDRAGLLKP